MLYHLVWDGQGRASIPGWQWGTTDIPTIRERRPEKLRRYSVAPEAKRLNDSAEGSIAGFESPVHLRRELGRKVPIIGFGQDALAAAQPHSPVCDLLTGAGTQLRANIG